MKAKKYFFCTACLGVLSMALASLGWAGIPPVYVTASRVYICLPGGLQSRHLQQISVREINELGRFNGSGRLVEYEVDGTGIISHVVRSLYVNDAGGLVITIRHIDDVFGKVGFLLENAQIDLQDGKKYLWNDHETTGSPQTRSYADIPEGGERPCDINRPVVPAFEITLPAGVESFEFQELPVTDYSNGNGAAVIAGNVANEGPSAGGCSLIDSGGSLK